MQLLEGKSNILNLLNLNTLWSLTLGDPNICIAVLDGPVDLSHPCFRGAALTKVKTLVSDTTSTNYALQHGTHVTSVIFGQHDSSVKGIAPRCRGLIIPVFADGVQGSLAPCSQIDLARAITQAVEHGANVINISGGQKTQSGQADPLLVRAVQLCVENNVLIVAAAGNDGCSCLHLPAALPTVLAVGAMDAQGLPLDFSNWGDAYQNQGILAPGEKIFGAVPGGTAFKDGTSFATPVVSGIVALLLSLQLKHEEVANPQSVRNAVLQSASPCNQMFSEDCRRFLAGSLNVTAAQTIIQGDKIAVSELNSKEMTQLPETNSTSQVGQVESSALPVENLLGSTSSTISLPTQPILPSTPTMTLSNISSSVSPSEGCSCGGSGQIQLVYAIGKLGIDWGTQSRRDWFIQDGAGNTQSDLLNYFAQHLGDNRDPQRDPQSLEDQRYWAAQNIIWTLQLDSTPIYAIMPVGAFASETYALLRSYLQTQINEQASIQEEDEALIDIQGKGIREVLTSVPGVLSGSIRLYSGQIVPSIIPDLRGLYNWSIDRLVKRAVEIIKKLSDNALSSLSDPFSDKLPPNPSRQQIIDYLEPRFRESMSNFIIRLIYQFRNLGVTPQERALNFAVTETFQSEQISIDAVTKGLELDSIDIEKSPICRPDSECYDVAVKWYDPTNTNKPTKTYRFTIDVSDVVPVSVGRYRAWRSRY